LGIPAIGKKKGGFEMDIVKTEYGLVLGVKMNGYTLYKGIPYAAPPVGELRWKAPQPAKVWEGVAQHDTWALLPHQKPRASNDYEGDFSYEEFYSDGYPDMSEDCLYLNIWTPAQIGDEALPVMVFFHGGGFQGGWAYEKEMDGAGMAAKGVILVTVEYRLGILGFMAHPGLTAESDTNASGNYGLLDQIAALKWLRRNIAAFGGNPTNITVLGQSAGAMGISILNVSPLAKGLFKQSIMVSGGYVNEKSLSWIGFPLVLAKAERIGLEIQERLNCGSIEEMRKVSAEKIQALQNDFRPRSVELDGLLFLLPNVDGYVLPNTVGHLVSKGKQADIAYMLGYDTNDIKNGDIASVEFAIEREKQGGKAYVFEFAHNLPGGGVNNFHTCELWYIFETFDRCWRPFTDEDYALGNKLAAYLCNFAAKGDPNGEGLERWEPYQMNNQFIRKF
jgi:para-nitrobenzyl esterase